MGTLRGNKRILSPLRRLMIYGALFALLLPLFHTHALSIQKIAASTHTQLSPSLDHGRDTVTAAPKTADTSDDCLVCQWLTQNHARIVPETVAFLFVTAEALLLLYVRFAALCARPAPRRGLRAPPFSFLTALSLFGSCRLPPFGSKAPADFRQNWAPWAPKRGVILASQRPPSAFFERLS